MNELKDFQDRIGYTFQDEDLLRQALTHKSYANEKGQNRYKNNERLEFLGDAVLEIISSDILFRQYPDWPEGQLTKCRASIVCEQTLAYCCKKLSLGSYLFLGRGEEMTGGRERPSILSDALEAVIGAIYLDGGMEAAGDFVHGFVMDDIEHMQLFSDSKTVLQEMVQAETKCQLSYLLIGESGPDHAKKYTVQAKIGDQCFGIGTGQTKKAAEQEAAYQTILMLNTNREA